MRFFRGVVVISVVFFCCFDFLAAAESLQKEQNQIVCRTLSNGLKILILEKHSMPIAAVQVWYNVGSVDEPNGIKGIAHLFEHMMFRGSKNFGPEQHSKLVKSAGGQWNAYTSDEMTVYWQTIPVNKLEMVLTLEADRMELLKLDQNNLDTERQVVMEEYRMRVDNDPFGSMEMQLRQFLFSQSPYQYGPIGKMDDIAKFSVQDCQKFYHSFYAPNDAVLVIVGDVKADDVIKMADTKFGSIKPSEDINKPKVVVHRELAALKNRAISQLPIPVTVLAFYTDGVRDADRPAFEVLYNCLAEGKSSRLWKMLMKDKKIAEFFMPYAIDGKDNGVILFSAAHLPYLSKKIQSSIIQQLEKVKASGLKESEIVKAKNQLRSQRVFQRYHANHLASEIGYDELIKGDYKEFYKADMEIENVTGADVLRVANKYFSKDNMRVVYFEPKQGMFLANVAGLVKSFFN